MIDFRLIKITLFNFACYYGENNLEFPTDTEKNIFLFNVPNGSGKTTLFHAIKWGFYGENIDYFKDSDKIELKDFLNDRLNPKEDMCYVKIVFEYGNEIYTLKRTYRPGLKKTSEIELSKMGVDFNSDEIQDILDCIIPKNFADFFMFDGEQLSLFMTAQKNIEMNYRDSILQLLGLKQLQILKDHLIKLEKKYDRELEQQNSTNKEVENKKKLMRELSKDIANEELRITQFEQDIQRNLSFLEKLEEQRQVYANLPKVMEDLERKNNEIQNQTGKVNEYQNQIKYSSNKLYIKFIEQDLQNLIETNNERMEKLQNICGLTDIQAETQSVKEEILRKSVPCCDVCGHMLDEKEILELKTEQEKIKESLELFKLNKNERDGLKDENQHFLEALTSIEGHDFQYLLYNLDEAISKKNDLEKEKEKLKKESERKEYGDLGKINREVSILEEENTTKREDIKLSKNMIRGFRKEKELINRELKKIGHDDRNTLRLSTNITYVTKLIKQLDEAIELGTDSKRNLILQKSNELFNKITNKPEEYSGIDFEDEDSYAFVIKTNDGKIVKNPSKGEKQVLAMSFLLGLNQYTGRNNLILMDTPVASLDDVHSSGIGKALADLNNQVIFLAQPQELAGEIYENMKPSVAKEFTVKREDYKSSFEEVTI